MRCRTSLLIAKTIGGSAPRRDLSRPRLQLFVPHAPPPPLSPLPSSLSYPFHLSLFSFTISRFSALFLQRRSPSRSPSCIYEPRPAVYRRAVINVPLYTRWTYSNASLSVFGFLMRETMTRQRRRSEWILIRETSNWISNWILPILEVFLGKIFFFFWK